MSEHILVVVDRIDLERERSRKILLEQTWSQRGRAGQLEFIAFGDIDGDGFLDLVSGNNGRNRVRFNDGTGGFPIVSDSLGRSQTRTTAICWIFTGYLKNQTLLFYIL